jgi:hypothetical protein
MIGRTRQRIAKKQAETTKKAEGENKKCSRQPKKLK